MKKVIKTVAAVFLGFMVVAMMICTAASVIEHDYARATYDLIITLCLAIIFSIAVAGLRSSDE